nr:MAG TPA: hypothetical protein [Caudoviricetes sp.]
MRHYNHIFAHILLHSFLNQKTDYNIQDSYSLDERIHHSHMK